VLDKDANFAIFFDAVGQEAGRTASASAAFDVVAHHAHGDMDFAFHFRLRRGNGVQTRRQRTQQAD
jgi:hypothetical protein